MAKDDGTTRGNRGEGESDMALAERLFAQFKIAPREIPEARSLPHLDTDRADFEEFWAWCDALADRCPGAVDHKGILARVRKERLDKGSR